MKISTTVLAVAIPALIAATGPAVSGDWNYGAGGAKDGISAAVPVPAPVGIPELAPTWYLRADIGVGFAKSGKVSAGGLDLGLFDSFGDQGTNGLVKFGFGRYITPTLRAEFSIDLRNQQKVAKEQRATYFQTDTRSYTGYDVTSTYQFDRDQSLTSANQTFMFNLYKDVGTWRGFTPYVSGGVGLALRTTKYHHTETATCVGSVDTLGNSSGSCNSSPTGSSGKGVETGYGVAVAGGAGFGYQIREGITWDVGWRYIWQSQQLSLATPAGLGATRIKFDDRGEHEVTTGLRFDID